MVSKIRPDIDDVRKEAEKEIREERLEKAKKIYKKKLQEIETARTVLKNLQRELEELEVELAEGL